MTIENERILYAIADLGEMINARFDRIDERFDEINRKFDRMIAKLEVSEVKTQR